MTRTVYFKSLPAGVILALSLSATAPLAPAQLPPVQPPPAAEAAPAAEPPPLEAEIHPKTLAMGDQGTLSFRVPGGRRLDSYPGTIEAAGLNIVFSATHRVPQSTGGKLSYTLEILYTIEALEPGSFSIPAQTFSVDGRALTSKAVDVTVNEGPPIDDALQPQAQLSVGKTEMWEGEEVPVTVAVLMHRSIVPTSSPFPVIKTDGVAVARFDRNARIDQTEINGDYWNAWQLPSAMTALKSGEFAFGPAEVKLEVNMPASANLQRDTFGGFPSVRRTLKVKTNTVPIRVKPLPAEDRPEGFNGAVGYFQVDARAESGDGGPQPVNLGDPVGFELVVTGIGNFGAVNAPELEAGAGFRAYKPKVSMENRGLGTEPGQKAFTQIVFAQKPGPATLVFTLPYFDPSTGKYAIAKSRPVEFIVTGSAEAVAAAESVAAAETRDFDGVSETVAPGEDLQDILPHAVDGTPWYSLNTAAIPVNPLLLHGVPAVFLALVLGAGTVRRLRAWAVLRRPPAHAPRELPLIVKDLRRSRPSYFKFYSLVSEYTGAWEFRSRTPLPADGDLQTVLRSRDRWLFAVSTDDSAAIVPAEEQTRVISTLTSRLRA